MQNLPSAKTNNGLNENINTSLFLENYTESFVTAHNNNTIPEKGTKNYKVDVTIKTII